MNVDDRKPVHDLLTGLFNQRRWSEAIPILVQTCRRYPELKYRQALAFAYQESGDTERALAMTEEILKMVPSHRNARTAVIFLRDLLEGTTLAEAARLRHQWWRFIGMPLAAHRRRAWANVRALERPLRVGYVTCDARAHSAARVWMPVVCHHTPAVESFVYASVPSQAQDFLTEKIRAATRFRDVHELDDPALAALITEDAIDILVDLSGFTAETRLPVFCLTPAPIQVQAWGYMVQGTGLPRSIMSHVMVDADVVTAEHWAAYYTEERVDLPCLVPWEIDPTSPPVAPLPAAGGAPFMFGGFNRIQKVTEVTLDLYAAALRAAPASRLLLKTGAFDQEAVRERIRQGFARREVDPVRVVFRGHTDALQHAIAYRDVDVALDSFPHGGGVTGLEAFQQGVPTITLRGERLVSRLAASYLTRCGLPDFVAGSIDEYAAIAAAWAHPEQRARLAALRAGAREALARSVLCTGYVEAVERAYRDLWSAWVLRQS